MKMFESKPADQWNDHDKMTFALAGLMTTASIALKDNLNPPYGWTDDYPERLLCDLDLWMDEIRELKK
jgi:hypothetical protein